MGDVITKLKLAAIVSGAALFVAACGQPDTADTTVETTTTTETTDTIPATDVPAVDTVPLESDLPADATVTDPMAEVPAE